MYRNSFPIVLNINHSFLNFEDTSTHFKHIWIIFTFYIYIIIITLLLLLLFIIILESKKKVKKKSWRRWRLSPKVFL